MPTFQEANSLVATIEGLLSEVPGVDILVVDDNSQDGTAQIADSLAAKHDRVAVLHRASKQGLGPAYIEGFRYAFTNNYDSVVEMDADGSHQASDLPRLLEANREVDLVIGSRWIAGGSVQNWPYSRLFLSKFGNLYARLMLGTRIFDMTSGFRVYKSEFLKKLISSPVSSQGYSFQVELAYRASKTGVVREVPITFIERAEGRSKMTFGIVLEALIKIQLWGIRRFFG
ncbi:MAG: glycosyltransferase [Actinobacteria bacterium]|nr:glycosyltransferase [Actinomycetota bacterium]